jgi:hypothetical protein
VPDDEDGGAGSTGTYPAESRELSPLGGGKPAVAGRASFAGEVGEDEPGQTDSRDEYPGGE